MDSSTVLFIGAVAVAFIFEMDGVPNTTTK